MNTSNEINARKKAKTTSTFKFSNLYTKIADKSLINILPENTNFVFKYKTCT